MRVFVLGGLSFDTIVYLDVLPPPVPHAGYLYGETRGYDVLRCMQLGTLVGGLCITSSELAHPQLSRAWVETAWSKQYGGAAREI